MPSVSTNQPHASIAAEALFAIGPIHFTNSMLMTLIVIAVVLAFFILGTRKMEMIPGRLQNAIESILEMLLGLVEGTAGKAVGRRVFPLIATLFIFILAANWFSLLPGVGSILVTPAAEVRHEAIEDSHGTGEELPVEGASEDHEEEVAGTTTDEHAEEGAPDGAATDEHAAEEEHHSTMVPLLRAPNADLNTTVAMALIAVIVVQISGIAAHGLGGYLKELATPIFLTPVHIMGEVSRILSLAARLFGNIFGGEVLLAVMFFLLSSAYIGFLGAIFLGLEVFFGLIQALLFSILTLNYIAGAVGGHGSGHDEHGHEHPGSEVPGAETLEHSAASGTMRHMG